MSNDLRYAWRQLRNSPAFTASAVFSLALGIAASTTMFSAFRAVFLQAPPYHEAGQLVEIVKTAPHGYTPSNTVAELQFIRRYARSFQAAAGFGYFQSVTLSGIADPVDLWVFPVSAELFPLLGTQPLLGRTFVTSDFRPNAAPAAVLAFEAWAKHFHSDPSVIGRTVFLNRQSYQITGVMPRAFQFPKAQVGAWLADRPAGGDPKILNVAIVARLRLHVSLEEARRELRALERVMPGSSAPDTHFTLEPIATRDIQEYWKAFVLLLAATGFLVLLACLNVANLLLARAVARRNEFVVRGALGAARLRLVGQVLTESLLLASLSGISGLGLAFAGDRLLLWLLPAYLKVPRLGESHIDVVVLAYAILLTLAVALLFGVAPAFVLSGTRLSNSDRQAHSTPVKSWRNGALLMGEIAVALVLFAGSVLMLRGFVRLAHVDPGVQTSHLLTAGVPPGHASRLTRPQQARHYEQLLQLAQSTPGVEGAALTSYLPFGNVAVQLQIGIPALGHAAYQVDFHAVSADYFHILGIPLLEGRAFDAHNPAADQNVAIINRAMADQFWPGRNPVGQLLDQKMSVIGVVGNTRHRTLSGAPVPEFYLPYQQYLGPAVGATLVLRTKADPTRVAVALRQVIHRSDPEQVVKNEKTMRAAVSESIAAPRLYTALFSTFALLALLLTLVGVYGVAAYHVSQRTREFGIRLAVGADRAGLIRMLLAQGLRQAMLGIGAGAFGAWACAKFLTGLVYNIPVRDPFSFAIAALVLLTGALLAYFLPAWRSARVNPVSVLRQN